MEDDLKFLKMEDDLKYFQFFLFKWKTPQFFVNNNNNGCGTTPGNLVSTKMDNLTMNSLLISRLLLIHSMHNVFKYKLKMLTKI